MISEEVIRRRDSQYNNTLLQFTGFFKENRA